MCQRRAHSAASAVRATGPEGDQQCGIDMHMGQTLAQKTFAIDTPSPSQAGRCRDWRLRPKPIAAQATLQDSLKEDAMRIMLAAVIAASLCLPLAAQPGPQSPIPVKAPTHTDVPVARIDDLGKPMELKSRYLAAGENRRVRRRCCSTSMARAAPTKCASDRMAQTGDLAHRQGLRGGNHRLPHERAHARHADGLPRPMSAISAPMPGNTISTPIASAPGASRAAAIWRRCWRCRAM